MCDNTSIPTVNGTELTDLASFEEAFGYLGKQYNDGQIYRNHDKEALTMHFRNRHPEHWDALQTVMRQGTVDVLPTVDYEGRLKVTVTPR